MLCFTYTSINHETATYCVHPQLNWGHRTGRTTQSSGTL